MALSRKGFRLVTDREFYRQVFQIMIPVVLQQAINIGVNMMDTVMLGSFGEAQLSASSLANSFYALFTVFNMGIIAGCSVLAAQYWGAGDKEKVRETFSLALRLAVALALVFTVVTILFPEQIMAIYSQEQDVIAYGVRYLEITAFIYLLHGTSMVTAFLMRSVQNARLGLLVSVISFLVNIGANWIFIFGKLGAPRMEIAGAALGTLIARAVEFAVTFGYVFWGEKALMLKPMHIWKRPSRELFYNYKRLGMAALFSDALLGIGSNAINIVLGHMGAAVVAANAVCQVVDRLFTVVTSGMGNASSIVTGNTIGRGEKEKALEQGKTFCVLSILLGLISCVLLLAFGTITIGLYSLEPETIAIAKTMMTAYGFIVIFQTTQSVMTKGVLRGGGDTKFLLVADILFLWIVSLPLGYWVGLVLKGPAWLTIICLRVDWIIKSIWCIGRLNTGKWIRETKKMT